MAIDVTKAGLLSWAVGTQDHVDWMDATYARQLALTLAEQVVPGGRVIWRSAALSPPYVPIIRDAGFDVRCVARADQGYMDRINMYATFYVAVRKPHMA